MVHSAADFYKEVINQVKTFKPDIVHVSSAVKALVVARLHAPRIPMVLTYHGTDVRGRKKVHAEAKLADVIAVSSPDLAKYGKWFDRPICSIFHYRGGRQEGTALMLFQSNFVADTREHARQWCAMRGIKLTILDRSKSNYITVPYIEMPDLYSKFEYYLDFKGNTGENFALSKAAMEAFACGCKVFHESGPITHIKFASPDEYYQLYLTLKRASLFVAIKRLARVLFCVVKLKLRALKLRLFN